MNPFGIARPTQLDLIAIARYNTGVKRAVIANREPTSVIDYAAKNAKTATRRRWVERKKAAS